MSDNLVRRKIPLRSDDEQLVFTYDGEVYEGECIRRCAGKSGFYMAHTEATARKLDDLVCALFNCDRPNVYASSVCSYIRATEWGARLP